MMKTIENLIQNSEIRKSRLMIFHSQIELCGVVLGRGADVEQTEQCK